MLMTKRLVSRALNAAAAAVPPRGKVQALACLAVLSTAACAASQPSAAPALAPVAKGETAKAERPSAPPAVRSRPAIDVPATKFQPIDHDRPGRSVDVPAFAIDKNEVTVGDYAACVDARVCSPPGRDSPECNPLTWAAARHPVNCVDVVQAQDFCAWVGQRLPTEDEWDAAARDPDPDRRWEARLCSSSAEPGTCEIAKGESSDRSHLGVFDMSGNVAEWTSTPFVFTEGDGPAGRLVLTTKGGSYRDGGAFAAPSVRSARAPRARYPHLGFRCVRGGKGRLLDRAAIAKDPPALEITEAELLERYTGSWKKLLAETNHVSVDEVDRSAAVTRASLDLWVEGTSFTVGYTLTLGWATVEAQDSFVVRIAPSSQAPSDALPLDRWLEAAHAEQLAREGSSRAKLSHLPLGKTLKYATRKAAIAALGGGQRASFDEDRVRVELARPQSPEPDLFMTGLGVIDERKNECLDVTLSLVTGEADRRRRPCAIR
jgi:formylglycine-generating enzyme required for sulfatase activity